MSPPRPTAYSGTSRLPLASRITYIAEWTSSHAVPHIEVKHHIERRPGFARQHLDEGRPLARRNGRERVCEELPPTQCRSVPVELTSDMRQAPAIECAKVS